MMQNSQIHFAIAFIYGTSISILNCTTSKVPAIYNFNYVILNYKLMNYFPIDKFSEFCQLGMIDIIHQLVVTNRRFLRIDELCLTVLIEGDSMLAFTDTNNLNAEMQAEH